MPMREFLSKFLRFLMVSGVGWLLDFGIFTALTGGLLLPVALSNYLSSLPAITFVFFVSTRKILVCREGGISRRQKYLCYVVYQLLLVTAVSFLAQWLAGALASVMPLWAEWSKLGAKVLITPITMISNFFVLKWIAEKW